MSQTSPSFTELLQTLSDEPYSAILRLKLAKCYEKAGYPDLAAGEAYMALLLADEIRDNSGEYHEDAVEAALEDARGTRGHFDMATGELEAWTQTHVEQRS